MFCFGQNEKRACLWLAMSRWFLRDGRVTTLALEQLAGSGLAESFA
jgi:hypothetical protein